MKKLLSAFILGSSLFAPIQAHAHEDGTYRGCVVGDIVSGCHLHQTISTKFYRRFDLHTMRNEARMTINCVDVEYPNQRRGGNLIDRNTYDTYPIECVFGISTRSNRSLSVYHKGARDPIFSIDFNHDVGR